MNLNDPNLYKQLSDPLRFGKFFWPDVNFYDKQRETIYSVRDNDETYVPAANKMGKDFVAAFICVWFFMTRQPCRIVTTSAGADHLRVLWGEIGRFIQRSRVPLSSKEGGPLIVNHQDIRRVGRDGKMDQISYITGLVASHDNIAKMQGHHANPDTVEAANDGVPRTLFLPDECSSVVDDYYTKAATWAKRVLAIGNTWPCNNFFKRAIKGNPLTGDPGGDMPRADGRGFHRKIIRITADDSPNVKYARLQERKGMTVTGEVIIPGVKEEAEYQKDRKLRDKVWLCVAHGADFYEGGEVLLYPPDWLNMAEVRHDKIVVRRRAKAIGVDPAEGGDKTTMAAVDEYGLIEMVSRQTPDTAQITSDVLAFMIKHRVPAEKVCFDRGGGGQQHADRLRQMGHAVRTVAFGEAANIPVHPGTVTFQEKVEKTEQRYVYANRRAEMYHRLRLLLDPALEVDGPRFAIPRTEAELRQQLAPMPLLHGNEGQIRMLPKNKRDPKSKEPTLVELIGHSPDEADALVLAIHGMCTDDTMSNRAGAVQGWSR